MQAAHAEICALQKSCDSLKATLKHMHAAHIAAEREVASLQQIRLDQVRLESSNSWTLPHRIAPHFPCRMRCCCHLQVSMQMKGSRLGLLSSERRAGARQEQELQAEIAALLARLECQAQEAAQLQRHREQARELTADLQTTTHALEASQARLQETAHTLQHTLQQLTQVPATNGPPSEHLRTSSKGTTAASASRDGLPSNGPASSCSCSCP